MAVHSAGLLLHRIEGGCLLCLLVHPGGPFWARKDAGAWSIPKGEFGPAEDGEAAARREFEEELGTAYAGLLTSLGEAVQPSRKVVHVWTGPGTFDPATLRSNLFTCAWPPGSGRLASFPEVDRAAWFTLADARIKILKGQAVFLDRLESLLDN